MPCTSCRRLFLTPLLTQPSSPRGLIYGPCFLPSSVLPSLPEAYVIQPEASEHSYPKPSVQLSLQHLRPYGIETAMGGAPATPVLRVQCPRVLRSLCQLVYFQTRPYAGQRAGHPHPGRSLIQTQVPLSDKIQSPATRCFSVYVQLISRRWGWDMGSESAEPHKKSAFFGGGWRCETCLLDIWVILETYVPTAYSCPGGL